MAFPHFIVNTSLTPKREQMQNESEMARRKVSSRYEELAARRHLPQVVREIDEALEEMRHEYLDMLDLRKGAVRRHGEQGQAPVVPPFLQEEAPSQPPVFAAAQKPLTIEEVWKRYSDDPGSPFQKLGYKSRIQYETLARIIVRERGAVLLSDVNARVLNEWHAAWGEGGKTAVSHAKIGMLRRLFAFGASVLEDAECLRLSTILHTLRFKMPKRRKEQLTAEQVIAIRAKAHERNRGSIALAQALQYDLGLRQADVIGYWVPMEEQGESDTVKGNEKWVRGIRWSDIDDNLVLRFSPPGHSEPFVANLRQSPMVMEELKLNFGFEGDRDRLNKSGPVVVSEWDDLPWSTNEFRRWWRLLATACSVPPNVRNMDSRAKIGRRPSQDYVDDDEDEMDDFADDNEVSPLH